ncbi:MAG: valine--tRNA ligase [Chitinivibrionales bacterium]|nr:valine--tRNA ligase [Chitinivibrionales bacterium]
MIRAFMERGAMPLPKKYDPNEAEPRIAARWREQNLFAFDPDSTAECYSVDTPPPYVSADHLHIGHAMSYSQAEFIVRYKRMRGYNVFYPMGFDDNGLPTERFVEQKYGIDKRTADRERFIELCLKETRAGAETYRTLWDRLGISVDWSQSYSTIDQRCRRAAQRSFIDLYRQGLIERRDEPVQWCYQCGTSLAQADIETREGPAEIHDIAFTGPDNQPLVISTTRPELLPACVALYAHPDDERYRALIGRPATVPLFGHTVECRTHPDVDPSYGTGLMMVCTWGDTEDVIKWRTDRLPTRPVFDEAGRLNELAGPFADMAIPEARRAILDALRSGGTYRRSRAITHTVGVHERCGTPAELNCTPQWFVNLLTHREQFRRLAGQLQWYPPFMKHRLDSWIDELKWDWCISRQRFYGVPFPVWYCRDCATPLPAPDSDLPVDPTLHAPPPGARCSCGGDRFEPEHDVMDTWMTSSLTPLITAGWAENDTGRMQRLYPSSVRVQAFEIIRTWLFYTLVKGQYHTESLPWRAVMISGWGLDEQGRKMSKRLGNYEDPMAVIERCSADAVRFWAATVSPGHDLRFSEETLADGRRLAVKLWNAARLVDSIAGEAPGACDWQSGTLSVADRWIANRYADTIDECTDAFDSYDYSRALRRTQLFFYNELCDNYLEIVKPRLWEESDTAPDHKALTQALLRELLLGALKLYAPILPFVTDELFTRLYGDTTGESSIHRSAWPVAPSVAVTAEQREGADMLLQLIAAVRKWKSERNVHPNHPIASLALGCSTGLAGAAQSLAPDLRTAARAAHVAVRERCSSPTEIDGVTMDIVLGEKRGR